MADKVILDKSILTGIGDAIREKKGTTDLIPSVNMESEIRSIQTGGGEDMLQQYVNAKGNCQYLFYQYKGKSLDFIKNLDLSNVASMEKMFYECTSLTEIPLLDTSNINNMDSLLYNCKALTKIPLFNTSNVLGISSAFYGCSSLTEIPALDTSKVNSFREIFRGCSSLTKIPLFNMSNVASLHSAFYGCSSLTEIPALDVSNVTNFNGLYNTFSGCSKLKSILMYGMKLSFDISASTQFEREDLVTILNNLAAVTSTQTLTMGSTNLAKLTDEDKAIATNKNWTLA